jgi:RNase H-fold protein (predicted Holliday junction resolvase)
MVKKVENILWIDWGSKKIGFAYINQWANNMIMPIWYIMNDWNFYGNVGEIIIRYNIKNIIIWYPLRQKDVQVKIDDFIKQLAMISWWDVPIAKMDEDYTSVEAWAVTWNFKKDEKTDTIAAMKILERFLEQA